MYQYILKNTKKLKPRQSIKSGFNRKKKASHKFLHKPSVKRGAQVTFCTGSKHEGTWDNIGMRGYGYYNLFYGADYDGDISDGMFHERGTLMYPNNAKMDGFWEEGHMVAHRYFFADNLCFGPYCAMPDRRFHTEMKESLRPAGRSLFTNSPVTRDIPYGCYDTGDGFYDPKLKCIYDASDPTKIVRIPTAEQHKWIIKNCRKAWDEPIGYYPDLYENWFEPEYESVENLIARKKKMLRRSVDFLSYRKNERVKVKFY